MLLLRWLVLYTFFFIFFLVIFLHENTKMIVNKEKKNETYETHLFKKSKVKGEKHDWPLPEQRLNEKKQQHIFTKIHS